MSAENDLVRVSYRLGVVSGFAFAAFLFSCIAMWINAEGIGWTETFAKWQTLIAGLLALFSALLAVNVVAKQMEQQANSDAKLMWRKHFAVRSQLPMALTGLCNYCDRSIDELKQLSENLSENGHLIREIPSDQKLPEIPISSLDTIGKSIESAPLELMPELASLVSQTQIQNSRLRSTFGSAKSGSAITVHEIDCRMLEALELLRFAGQFFSYARRRLEAIEQPSTEFFGLTLLRGLENRESLQKLIELRASPPL